MANFCSGMRSAINLICNIDDCLNEAGIKIKITMYPWQSTGGRSNGISALFESFDRKYVAVSIAEHCNSDQINLYFNSWIPNHMYSDHDTPHIQFNCNQVQATAYAIQSFIVQTLNIQYPDEWYVPSNDFKGMENVDEKLMDFVDDKMTPILVKWSKELNM